MYGGTWPADEAEQMMLTSWSRTVMLTRRLWQHYDIGYYTKQHSPTWQPRRHDPDLSPSNFNFLTPSPLPTPIGIFNTRGDLIFPVVVSVTRRLSGAVIILSNVDTRQPGRVSHCVTLACCQVVNFTSQPDHKNNSQRTILTATYGKFGNALFQIAMIYWLVTCRCVIVVHHDNTSLL